MVELQTDMPRVAVFISGGGSNLQALIDAVKAGILRAEIALVVSSRRTAGGLQRAEREEIDNIVFKSKQYESDELAGAFLLEQLHKRSIDYIALAGFMSLLPLVVVKEYTGRIINVHPALLPKYGGKGMFGHYVHEAVLKAGDKQSGVTVHLVDEIYDNGRILEQVTVPVESEDTAETLAARILKQEHRFYPRVLQKLINGEYK